MIYEDYNKGGELNHCPICKKVFEDGEYVSVINPAKGPFMIIHKTCYNHLDENSKLKSNVSPKVEILQDEDKLWRYMDLAKFISIMKMVHYIFLHQRDLVIFMKVRTVN